jgi:hypothetical protein
LRLSLINATGYTMGVSVGISAATRTLPAIIAASVVYTSPASTSARAT